MAEVVDEVLVPAPGGVVIDNYLVCIFTVSAKRLRLRAEPVYLLHRLQWVPLSILSSPTMPARVI